MNKINYVSSNEYKISQNTKAITIDGLKIQNLKEYFKTISEKFSFPNENERLNYSAYTDWLTDLSWLDSDSIALVIKNFSMFMRDEQKEKTMIMEIFKDDILPFWDKEVENSVVGGKRRDFNIYCLI